MSLLIKALKQAERRHQEAAAAEAAATESVELEPAVPDPVAVKPRSKAASVASTEPPISATPPAPDAPFELESMALVEDERLARAESALAASQTGNGAERPGPPAASTAVQLTHNETSADPPADPPAPAPAPGADLAQPVELRVEPAAGEAEPVPVAPVWQHQAAAGKPKIGRRTRRIMLFGSVGSLLAAVLAWYAMQLFSPGSSQFQSGSSAQLAPSESVTAVPQVAVTGAVQSPEGAGPASDAVLVPAASAPSEIVAAAVGVPVVPNTEVPAEAVAPAGSSSAAVPQDRERSDDAPSTHIADDGRVATVPADLPDVAGNARPSTSADATPAVFVPPASARSAPAVPARQAASLNEKPVAIDRLATRTATQTTAARTTPAAVAGRPLPVRAEPKQAIATKPVPANPAPVSALQAASEAAPAPVKPDTQESVRFVRADRDTQQHLIWLTQAYQALASGQDGQAGALYKRVAQADRNSIDAQLGLASLALRANDPERARRHYSRALEIDPRDASARSGLIGLQSEAQPDDRISRIRHLIAGDGANAGLHFELGNLLAAQQRWGHAQQAYFDAFSADPANPDYAFNLAVSLERIRQPATALVQYEQALKLAEGRPAAFDAGVARARIAALGSTGTR